MDIDGDDEWSSHGRFVGNNDFRGLKFGELDGELLTTGEIDIMGENMLGDSEIGIDERVEGSNNGDLVGAADGTDNGDKLTTIYTAGLVVNEFT